MTASQQRDHRDKFWVDARDGRATSGCGRSKLGLNIKTKSRSPSSQAQCHPLEQKRHITRASCVFSAVCSLLCRGCVVLRCLLVRFPRSSATSPFAFVCLPSLLTLPLTHALPLLQPSPHSPCLHRPLNSNGQGGGSNEEQRPRADHEGEPSTRGATRSGLMHHPNAVECIHDMPAISVCLLRSLDRRRFRGRFVSE